jgi:hypothetical protein
MRIVKIAGLSAGGIVVLLLALVNFVRLRWDAKNGRQVSQLKAPTYPEATAPGLTLTRSRRNDDDSLASLCGVLPVVVHNNGGSPR